MFFRFCIRILSSTFMILVLVSIISASTAYYYFMHTTSGAKLCFNYVVSHHLGAKLVKYRGFEGTFAKGIKISNIRIEDVNKFTTRNLILIQQLEFSVPGLNIHQLVVKIRNGRIKFPLSDPLGFYGTINGEDLKFNLYCGIIDVREIVTVIKSDLSLHNLEGTARKAQMTITGNYKKPELKGDFLLEDMRYLGISLAQLPADFHYTLESKDSQLSWTGVLNVSSGQVISGQSKINLKPSRLIFDGPFKNPQLDVSGSTKTDQIEINVSLGGTKRKPVLNVTSNPPKPRNVLLVLLATGQELKVAHDVAAGENFSDNDFVNFFTYQGLSEDAVGLTDFSFNMQEQEKWLGIKRRLNNQLKVGINVQEKKTVVNGQSVDVTRSVGGEVQVADHITVGVDKKVSQVDDPAERTTSQQQKDRGMDVMIKYKKNF